MRNDWPDDLVERVAERLRGVPFGPDYDQRKARVVLDMMADAADAAVSCETENELRRRSGRLPMRGVPEIRRLAVEKASGA